MRRRRSSEAIFDQGNIRVGSHCPSVGVDVRSEINANNSGMGEKSINSNLLPESASMTAPSNVRTTVNLQHYRRFYFLHSSLVLAVLVLGMINNGGNRKYIPVDPKELFNLLSSQTSNESSGAIISDGISKIGSCRKAYVNVHSFTIEDKLSAICCYDSSDSSHFSEEEQYQSNLCNPIIPIIGVSTQQLPFARRLTRLTEAWVLPLLPIIIRLTYQFIVFIWTFFTRSYRKRTNREDVLIQREATSFSNSQASSSSLSSNTSNAFLDKTDIGPSSTAAAQLHTSNHKSIRTTLQRLLFYFVLFTFRGWGLYIGANAVEDYIILPWITGNTVVSPLRTNSMSDVEHDLHYTGNEPECWYKQILKPHHKSAMENDGHSDCYGRSFDFSDHVVLFLAHYLPIIVMEMLLYYSFPFWNLPVADKAGLKRRLSSGVIWNALHAFLFLYLHLLVLHTLYQTAVYFHTPAEIIVGYGVSLIIHLPVVYLMCSEGLPRARKCIGLPSVGGIMSEKGD